MEKEILTELVAVKVTKKMKDALEKMAQDERRRLSDILRYEFEKLLGWREDK